MSRDREISRAEARRAVLRELDRRLRCEGRQKPADQATTPTRDNAADGARKRIDER